MGEAFPTRIFLWNLVNEFILLVVLNFKFQVKMVWNI